MRAAVFRATGQPLDIREVPAPVLTGGDLILAVKCCGICGSDLHLAEAHADSGVKPLPAGAIMGHEFAGEVVEVGREAGGFRPGDRVTAMPFIACGRCVACLTGSAYRCSQVRYSALGDAPGAYAEYMRVGAAETLRLPPGVDYTRGALVEPLAVGLHGMNAARLAAGESVLIMGAGPIGLACVLWSRYFGARHVMVTDRVPARLALAEKLGATAVIDASRENVAEACKRLAGKRPEVILECVGVPGTQQLAMDYAPVGGRIVVIGVCMAPDMLRPVKAITKELQVNYVYMYRRQEFELTLDLLDRGLIDPSPMLTASVSFEEFPAVFEQLKHDKTACKVMLRPPAGGST